MKTTHKFTRMSSRTWKRSSNTETWKKSCWKPNSHRQTWYWRRQRRSTNWKKSMYVLFIRFVECYGHFNNTIAIILTFIEHFNIPQLLKQVAENKSQMKLLKEQEIVMKNQVHQQGIMSKFVIVLFFPLSRGMNDVFLTFSPQLDMYSKKFDEFQGTVSKSNSVYSSFKQDLDKVGLLQNIWNQYCLYCLVLSKNIFKTSIRKKGHEIYTLLMWQLFLEFALIVCCDFFVCCRWPRKWKSWRRSACHGRLALMPATRISLTWWQM